MNNSDNNFRNSNFLKKINTLTKHHIKNSNEYKFLIKKIFNNKYNAKNINQIPFIPVRLFKEVELKSISNKQIVKTMMSSGTSNNGVSKIFLDKQTSASQIKALSKIVTSFIGSKRKPMLIIDNKSIILNRDSFSARTAAVLGFSIFGRDIEYALDKNFNLDLSKIKRFLSKHKNEEILIFGFTYIIWEKFIIQLEKLGVNLEFDNGILIHGGGWKKLQLQSISNHDFKKKIVNLLNISKVHNYYGMVEQTGSIFMECKDGFLHSSEYSDIIIRDALTFEQKGLNEQGLIQLISTIPKSYPGHSILSEDVGEIYGYDNCDCGRKGTFFKVIGRVEEAEIRGCSDTFT